MALRCSWRFLVPRMYSEHSDAKIMKCNRYLKQNFPLKPLLQGELILSRCSLPYELPFPDTEVSKSVFIAQNQPLRCFGAGTPCRSQPLTPFIDRLGIGLVSLRHAEMALEYLWGGSPCRRPARSPLRHDGMPLEYLWAWSPCRRPVGRTLRHAGMALRWLWKWAPCRRPVRRTLCHAITCIRMAQPASRVRGSTRLSEVFRCPRPSIFVKFTWHANPHYRYL